MRLTPGSASRSANWCGSMGRAKRPKAYRDGGYIQVPNVVIESAAYRSLSLPARALLTELLYIYRPHRQGRICLEVRRAAELMGVHKDTASKAFRQLEDRGFIRERREAFYPARQAREWRITFLPDAAGHQPTDEWKRYGDSLSQSEGHAVLNEGTRCPNPRDTDAKERGKVVSLGAKNQSLGA